MNSLKPAALVAGFKIYYYVDYAAYAMDRKKKIKEYLAIKGKKAQN